MEGLNFWNSPDLVELNPIGTIGCMPECAAAVIQGRAFMDFLIAVATSTLLATIIGKFLDAYLDDRKAERNTKLDALTAAVALEGYAINCAELLSSHSIAETSDGYAGAPLGKVPELPTISINVGFLRPKKTAIANRLLTFPQTVKQADQAAAFWWDVVGDIDATRVEATRQTARMALNSLELASDLRSAFNLPTRKLVFGEYNIRKVLEENVE